MPTTITILNSSFENEELKDGKHTYGSSTGPVEDWNLINGNGGTYDPKDPKSGKDPEISNISEENIAYLYDEGTKLRQQLDYNYVSNEQVTFSIDIGDPDYSDASDYIIRILAGTEEIGSLTGTTSGTDTLSTVTVTSSKIDPTLDGLLITIEIEKVGSGGDELHVDNAQASFDILADGIVDGTNSDDTISIGFVDADGDIVDGADGLDDVIDGGAGNDTIDGGDGNDLVRGGIGNDDIDGGTGDDDIFGEGGDDNITVGVGDTATGGADADTFTLDFDQTSSGGSTNINIHGSTTEDAGVDDDTLDLTGFGKFVLTETIDADGDSTSGTAIYDSGQTVNFSEIENLIVCFAKGTHIRAESGIRAIETLKVGDRLMTLDNDLQTIRWVGERSLGDKMLAAYPNLRPIRIKAEALGDGMPSHDLIVSPQHRIVVRSKIAIRMFAAAEVFVPAKHLLGLKGVTIATDITEVTYYHLLCDSHEIIEANGALAETLYTGTEAMKAMTPEALEELALIFGDQPIGLQPLARFSPKGQRAKKLVERHIKNDRAMYC